MNIIDKNKTFFGSCYDYNDYNYLGYLIGFVYITTASWPLYIDLVGFGLGVLLSVPYVIINRKDFGCSSVMLGKCLTGAMAGAVSFIIMFFWCGLSVSIWWYLLALVIGIIASFIPCGFTIASLLIKNIGLIPSLPGWASIILIVMDVICLVMYIQALMLIRKR